MVNPQTNRESSPAAFLVIALFILVPPLGILAAIVLAVYSKTKKASASAGRPTRTGTAPPPRPRNTASPEKDRHGHTPQTYSYDACAVDRRLEQLEALKKAGLMEQEEYLRFRDKITNGA